MSWEETLWESNWTNISQAFHSKLCHKNVFTASLLCETGVKTSHGTLYSYAYCHCKLNLRQLAWFSLLALVDLWSYLSLWHTGTGDVNITFGDGQGELQQTLPFCWDGDSLWPQHWQDNKNRTRQEAPSLTITCCEQFSNKMRRKCKTWLDECESEKDSFSHNGFGFFSFRLIKTQILSTGK